MTTTTSFGLYAGAQDAYQEWSLPGGASAVPVLPATGIGKFPNTAADVPECAPAYSPARIVPTSVRLRRRRGGKERVLTICPLGSSTARPTCGLTTVPPLASVEYAVASCSGVIASCPCPTARLTE